MTPKEKAKDLVDKYIELSGIFIGDYENEKEMCLIAVDEVIEALREHEWQNRNIIDYYLEVKQEIELL
jgi:hypothetical protein